MIVFVSSTQSKPTDTHVHISFITCLRLFFSCLDFALLALSPFLFSVSYYIQLAGDTKAGTKLILREGSDSRFKFTVTPQGTIKHLDSGLTVRRASRTVGAPLILSEVGKDETLDDLIFEFVPKVCFRTDLGEDGIARRAQKP